MRDSNTPPLLIKDAHVLDLDDDLDHPPVKDIFITDGKIADVGSGARAAASKMLAVEELEGAGKLVIPGLINAHYHSHDVMMRGMFEQLPLDAWAVLSQPRPYSRPSVDQLTLRTQLGVAECLLNGITTVQDMVTIADADRDAVEALKMAYAASGIRVSLALQISDLPAASRIPFLPAQLSQPQNGVSGAIETASLRALIEDCILAGQHHRLQWGIGLVGPQRCSNELLRWAARLSRTSDVPVFTHLYESRAQAVLARQEYPGGSLVEHLRAYDLLNERLTAVHGVWTSSEEIQELAKAGSKLILCPVSNMKLLNGVAPVRDYANAGVTLGLGCDNCSANDGQNIFQVMKMFALFWGLLSKAGESGAARAAFAAATVGGAHALGMSGKLGRVMQGYFADLVIIDLGSAAYRPLNSAVRQLVYAETGRSIETVIVGGQPVVQGGALLTLDERALKQKSEAWRVSLAEEARRLYSTNLGLLRDILHARDIAQQFPLEMDRRLFQRQ